MTIDNYEEKRRELVELNSNVQGVILREKEQRVEEELERLRNEFFDSCNGDVIYDIPTLNNRIIQNSRLYKFCDCMPKGADLHVHDMSILPAHELVELLITCPEFCINTDRKSYDLVRAVNGEIPSGYIRFCDAVTDGYYTKEEIVYQWTIDSVKESGETVWEYFEKLFSRHDVLSNNPDFARKYYDYTFRYCCRHGIMHIEIHLMLTESQELCSEYVTAIRAAYYDVKKEHPYFTVRIIGTGVKDDNEQLDLTKKCFQNTVSLQKLIKDESNPDSPRNFIIGFDLANEEDSSLPLKTFAPMLLKAKELYPDLKLYIHGGESLDAGNDNLIDAFLLGVTRVGHGLNLYRYPDLHARYVRSEICLEVCPISNQRLGYTRDLRNHPVTEYLKTGLVMALCSDDPTYMEHQELSDDFFAAVVCWGARLSDLKVLAINSIMYSGLDEKDKYKSLGEFKIMWDAFIDSVETQGIGLPEVNEGP
ncbi:MAG: hypothetical protein Q4E54_06870 [Lachnospiraceae bacterium]|nr:hypothetical protein [Lachnospiraceae bacterium]